MLIMIQKAIYGKAEYNPFWNSIYHNLQISSFHMAYRIQVYGNGNYEMSN